LSSRDITIQFDSRSLGWFWQPELVSSLPKGLPQTTDEEFTNSLSLDKNTSKLWIENIEGSWDYFTFTQFETLVEAYKSSLLSKTFYQVGSDRRNLISDEQTFTNALVKGLELLKPIMPDLTQLQQPSSSNVKLQNLAQITHIDAALKDGQQGVDVFFKQALGSTDVYKIFIHESGATPIASTAEIQSKPALMKFELSSSVDIDLDSVIGATASEIIFNAAANETTGMLDSLYRSVLERIPDDEGLNYWDESIRKGFSKEDLLFSFLASEEFLAMQGSNQEFVDHLYAHVLNRQADEPGFEYWMKSLENGASQSSLLMNFIISEEFVGLFGMNGDLPPSNGAFGFS